MPAYTLPDFIASNMTHEEIVNMLDSIAPAWLVEKYRELMQLDSYQDESLRDLTARLEAATNALPEEWDKIDPDKISVSEINDFVTECSAAFVAIEAALSKAKDCAEELAGGVAL